MRRSLLFLPALAAAVSLAGSASAATPRLALFDVQRDLARASHNAYGDVRVWKRSSALAARASGSALVRCGSDCTFGPGWVAFSGTPAFASGDVLSARAKRTKSSWSLILGLNRRGTAGLTRFQRLAALSGRTRGVADALVIVLNGTIIAQPLASQIRRTKAAVEIPGFSHTNAIRAAKLFTS
jgi:hypothetical protein